MEVEEARGKSDVCGFFSTFMGGYQDTKRRCMWVVDEVQLLVKCHTAIFRDKARYNLVESRTHTHAHLFT